MSKVVFNETSDGAVLLTDFPGPHFTVSAERVVSVRNAAAEAIIHEDLVGRTVSEAILEQLDALSAGQRAAWSHAREFVLQIGRESAARFFLPQFSQLGTDWAVLFLDVSDLWAANRSTMRAFSLLGHEVKTPITSIRMALHLLLEEKLGTLTPEQRELVEASRDDCENMLHLVQQIGEIFLIESEGAALTRTLVEPAKILATPLAETRHLFERNSLQMVIHTPPEKLPQLNIDVSKVERAVGELLRNAAFIGIPGEKTSISFAVENGWLRISVGSAVANDGSLEKRKASEPFGLRRGPRGGDLGLAICKALITAQGGRMGFKIAERYQELYLELPVSLQS